eukprot:TCONS_00065960-protein
MVALKIAKPSVVFFFLLYAVLEVDCTLPKVTRVKSGNVGSLAGGTMLILEGVGFSEDMYTTGKGNEVYFEHKISKEVLTCKLVMTDSNEKRIACETPPEPSSRDGDYHIKVKVDGESIYCTQTFHYRNNQTPFIRKITSQSGFPGETMRIEGRFLSKQISRIDGGKEGDGETFVADAREINKFFVGTSIGNAFDETNEIIGMQFDSNNYHTEGWVKIQAELKIPGSFNVSFITSLNAGRSRRLQSSLFVDATDEIYNYQTYALVHSIKPNKGSMEGGTTLEIHGEFFGTPSITKNVWIKVAGIKCEVIQHTREMIKCITGKADQNLLNGDLFAGGRGYFQEAWPNHRNYDVKTVRTRYNSTYPIKSLKTTEYALQDYNNYDKYEVKLSYASARYEGFLRPPYSGMFRLMINCDDQGEFFISQGSQNRSRDNMTLVAFSYSHTNRNFWYRASQQSEPMYLDRNKEYFYQAYVADGGGSLYFQLGLFGEKTQHPNSRVNKARDEKQQIFIKSYHRPNVQILNMTNASLHTKFNISMDGKKSSQEISRNSTTKEIEKVFYDLFSTSCEYQPIPESAIFYHESYETSKHKDHTEYGWRTTNKRAACGRYSLKMHDNNNIAFLATRTARPDTGRINNWYL